MVLKVKKAVLRLHPLERKVLPFVGLGEMGAIANKAGLSLEEVRSGLQMLEAKGYLILDASEEKFIVLSKLGKQYVGAGKDLPHVAFLKAIVKGPKKMSQVGKDLGPAFSSALGFLKRESLVNIEKKKELVFSAAEGAVDFLEGYVNPLEQFADGVALSDIGKEQKKQLKELRNFVQEVVQKSFSVELTKDGKALLKELLAFGDVDLTEALSSDMLKDGSWKEKEFRHYDISVAVPYHGVARRHPMLEANNIIRDLFVEMGFQEMQGPMVEAAFWNMDVMWIPQDHPARDDQDTFYLEGEAKIPSGLVAVYKKMHEEGIGKSHTPKGQWSKKVAARRLLRTHSTSTTFRTLARLAAEAKKRGEKDIPNGKYFYVANVFRNEAIDATHLAEFYQGEGFIVGDDLGLADLMGFVKAYYAKLGLHKIRFKPTFNPYTEPSMEAHYYDEKMGKWYALINSGIFRQETLKPLGINKTIIAWGMGASRLAALLARRASMRDITGATCDFKWMKERPMMSRDVVRK